MPIHAKNALLTQVHYLPQTLSNDKLKAAIQEEQTFTATLQWSKKKKSIKMVHNTRLSAKSKVHEHVHAAHGCQDSHFKLSSCQNSTDEDVDSYNPYNPLGFCERAYG